MSHLNTVTGVRTTDYSGSETDYRLVRSVGDGLRKSLGVTHVKTGGGLDALCFGNRRGNRRLGRSPWWVRAAVAVQ